jgi:hypothetical protein
VPPPTLGDTVRDVIERIDTDHILSFVARAIAEDPRLAPVVVDSLGSRIDGSPGDLTTMAAALAGLRLADFVRTARRWVVILDKHDVPVPHRPLGLDLAMIDSELVDGLDPRLVSAIEEIRRDRASSTLALRDQLFTHIGVQALNDLVHQATRVSDVSALLSPLAGTGVVVVPPPSGAPLRSALRDALADIGELIASAANVSLATGEAFLEAAGGSDTIIERLKQDHPWLLDLSVVNDGDEHVLRGRILHVADRHNPNPERDIKALAALGLRCLPDVDRADLTTVLAGGVPLRVNDHEIAIVRWFTKVTANLPAPMRAELAEWVDVMRHGNPVPPRSKPRSEDTLRSQLYFALPALTRWASRHDSLREISRADVLAALPPSGAPRASMAQALRSIFRALKARKLVFGNPMFRIHVPAPEQQIPTVPDLVRLREALDSPDPARALIAALLAYHAVRIHQLRDLKLTDLHDGRLHLHGQTILLADPVRDRLGAYLDHRSATWPTTINPHLLVNVRSWAHTRPVNKSWTSEQLGMSGQQIRLDRIFYEATTTGGDLRVLADLFGLSIASAARYASVVDRAAPPADIS